MEGVRAKLTDVNPHLVCVLCHGYFVDATTIAECLHSFCRSCIFRHLERKPICPICEVAVHNTKLHRSLRPDKTLQDIVYKLVPGLYRNEMQRRREFYKQHPFRDEYLEPECRGVGLDRVIYSPDDLISLSLEFYDEDREREEWNNNNVIQKPVPIKKPPPGSKRYLQCPAGFKMRHLKKFIRQKCGLTDNCEVEVIYRKESLPDSYSLMDIAYIYTWKRNEPMRFYYKLPDVPMKTLDAARALASHKIVQELPCEPQTNGDLVEPTKNNISEEHPIEIADPSAAEKKTESHHDPMKVTNVADCKPPVNHIEQRETMKSNTPKVNGMREPFTNPKHLGPSETQKSPETPVPSTTPDVVSVSKVTSPATSTLSKAPVTAPAQIKDKTDSEPTTPRTMTKQDELPVSVLLSLGNCTPEIKRPSPIETPSPRPEPKFILPKPVDSARNTPLVDQLLNKKIMSSKANSKMSVNKIASDLAESKTTGRNVFKTPPPKPQLAPFSQNPLMLNTPPMGQGMKLADPAAGNRTPFHHSQVDYSAGNRTPFPHSKADPTGGNRTAVSSSPSPQHLPVYPPPLMPPLSKALPWKDPSKDQSRFSLFPQSPRHVPQYPTILPKDKKRNGKAVETKKPSQDPFLFPTNESENLKKERLTQSDGNSNSTSQQSSLPSSPRPKQNISNQDTKSLPHAQNGFPTHKTDRPEVTVNTSNGSLTISTQLPNPPVNSKIESTDLKNKTVPPQVLQKNVSGQRLNGNVLGSGPNKKKSGLENKPKNGSENKNGDADGQKMLGSEAGTKNLSLARKNHASSGGLLIPGGVVSRTGPTLDQRLQQLYKSNSRQLVNGQSPSQKSQPIPTGKQQSRLASWLNNRFNAHTKSPSPTIDKIKAPEVIIDKISQESATEKLGKEMSMLKKKLDELRKNSEGCEITQENPTPDVDKKIRDVTPNVSIELMKAADMKKLDVGSNKTKDKGVKRPVPGLKAIQDVDVKKIKLSSDDEEPKKPKSDKKTEQEVLDLSGSGKPSDELAHRIALLQKNGALSNQQQFNWLLNRPLIAGQQFPRST
ncbi:hypothetical protein GE061_016616 [Apolygus lucorum]|uniref:RING-type domain-containing protein n=1 Tax=Apolygus lucorum TaxID=248454 RepID=A0A8S9XKQ3_APOLU|nr:hypothetical protein GE061_016616 [Apolygus lucorum]